MEMLKEISNLDLNNEKPSYKDHRKFKNEIINGNTSGNINGNINNISTVHSITDSQNNSDKSDDNEESDSKSILIMEDSGTTSPRKRNSIKDFHINYVLGKGSYAKVVLATNIYTNKQYALKLIDKKFLEKVKIF
jgi:hypothetical protein